MTLAELNEADESTADHRLRQCCASRNWTSALLSLRPFPDVESFLTAADRLWWRLDESDWLQAFSAHPRIGERNLSAVSAQEQSGVDATDSETLEQLIDANEAYEQRFGFIFLVKASGKTAGEMLTLLRLRLQNDPPAELRIAAGEQAKITRLRLQSLVPA